MAFASFLMALLVALVIVVPASCVRVEGGLPPPDRLVRARPNLPTKHYATGALLVKQPTLHIHHGGMLAPGTVGLRLSDPRKAGSEEHWVSLGAGESSAWGDLITRYKDGRWEGILIVHEVYVARINDDGSVEAYVNTSVKPLERARQ